MEKEDFIAGVERELIDNGVDEPVLLGIVHSFLKDCPPVSDNINIAGGEDSKGNQFVIIELDPIQYVLLLEYPFVRSYIANVDQYKSETLDYSPNVSVSIEENTISDLFHHFSRIPLLFATLRHRYGKRKVTPETFDMVAKEIGIDGL